jgi:hypothetical protein
MKLLESLKPHCWNENKEIVFEKSNITLNIDEALYSPFIVTLFPEKLFSYRQGQLRSASLYWEDDQYALRAIGPDHIAGIEERKFTLQSVSLICGITLQHPKETVSIQRHQQCFQHPECPSVHPICPSGRRYDGYNIIGWRRTEN